MGICFIASLVGLLVCRTSHDARVSSWYTGGVYPELLASTCDEGDDPFPRTQYCKLPC